MPEPCAASPPASYARDAARHVTLVRRVWSSDPPPRQPSREAAGQPRAPVKVARTASAAQIHPEEVMRWAAGRRRLTARRLASGEWAGHEQCDDGVAGTTGDL